VKAGFVMRMGRGLQGYALEVVEMVVAGADLDEPALAWGPAARSATNRPASFSTSSRLSAG
jgi:hypothetical protein